MSISLREQFGDDADFVKEVLLIFSSIDPVTGENKRDARIVSIGRRVTGDELRNEGMARAQVAQEAHCPGWGEVALNAVKEFVKSHSGQFQAEDIRTWARNVPQAPNLRAWGNVMVRAAKEGIIKHAGYERVNNPMAHGTPASSWQAA